MEVREGNFPPIRIHLRGVTGSTKILPLDANAPGTTPGKAAGNASSTGGK